MVNLRVKCWYPKTADGKTANIVYSRELAMPCQWVGMGRVEFDWRRFCFGGRRWPFFKGVMWRVLQSRQFTSTSVIGARQADDAPPRRVIREMGGQPSMHKCCEIKSRVGGRISRALFEVTVERTSLSLVIDTARERFSVRCMGGEPFSKEARLYTNVFDNQRGDRGMSRYRTPA
jgi:hypothetical protein